MCVNMTITPAAGQLSSAQTQRIYLFLRKQNEGMNQEIHICIQMLD